MFSLIHHNRAIVICQQYFGSILDLAGQARLNWNQRDVLIGIEPLQRLDFQGLYCLAFVGFLLMYRSYLFYELIISKKLAWEANNHL